MNKKVILLVFLLIGGLLLGLSLLQAQDTCPSVDEAIILAAIEQCELSPIGSLCLGSGRAIINDGQEVASGSTIPLDHVQHIQLTSEADGREAFAVLRVPAAAPDGRSSLVMLAIGEVTLDNTGAGTLPASFTATVNTEGSNLNLREIPSADGAIMATVPNGSSITGDVISPDGQWLRVAHQGRFAWVASNFVAGIPEGTQVLDLRARYNWQSFDVLTVGREDCSQSESMLILQSPQNVQSLLNINGSTVVIGSTIALQTEDGNLNLLTLEGQAVIGADALINSLGEEPRLDGILIGLLLGDKDIVVNLNGILIGLLKENNASIVDVVGEKGSVVLEGILIGLLQGAEVDPNGILIGLLQGVEVDPNGILIGLLQGDEAVNLNGILIGLLLGNEAINGIIVQGGLDAILAGQSGILIGDGWSPPVWFSLDESNKFLFLEGDARRLLNYGTFLAVGIVDPNSVIGGGDTGDGMPDDMQFASMSYTMEATESPDSDASPNANDCVYLQAIDAPLDGSPFAFELNHPFFTSNPNVRAVWMLGVIGEDGSLDPKQILFSQSIATATEDLFVFPKLLPAVLPKFELGANLGWFIMFGYSQNGLMTPVCGADTVVVTPIEPPNEIPQTTGGNCGDFGITSPLGLAYGFSTIYWNPAAGATNYFVSISGGGTSLASRSVAAPETNTSFDTGAAIGAGDSFLITVDAYADNRLLCSSSVTLQREAAPPQETAEICGNNNCSVRDGENTSNCSADCQCFYNGVCDPWERKAQCPNECP